MIPPTTTPVELLESSEDGGDGTTLPLGGGGECSTPGTPAGGGGDGTTGLTPGGGDGDDGGGGDGGGGGGEAGGLGGGSGGGGDGGGGGGDGGGGIHASPKAHLRDVVLIPSINIGG